MNLSEENIEISGYTLRRHVFHPAKETPIRGSAFLLHGQGDHAGRYGAFLQPFLQKGIICVGTDFPGHGYSDGKRGHIPGIELVDQISLSNRHRCRELTGAEGTMLGIIGHSAGGLLALREILERPRLYGFAWISSPLLRPEAGHNPVLVRLAGLIARFYPQLTISTGVSYDQCSSLPEAHVREGHSNRIHSRISSSWGHTLIHTARHVRKSFQTCPPQIPLLLTQGLKDSVCSPQHLRNLLEGLEIPTLTLREFPEALHEPFADATGPEVCLAMAQWLEQISKA